MGGFFSKLFGGSKQKSGGASADLVQSNLLELIEKGRFDLDINVSEKSEEGGDTLISIDFSGNDEELLKDRKGQLLDAFQLYTRRVLQHHFPEGRYNVVVDCGGFREETEQALLERADSLKAIAIEQGKSVYYRALPPRERKIIHQYLAQDPRVKSRSLGEGLYKKIKIYPVKSNESEEVIGE